MPFYFKIAPLPRPVYELLQRVGKAEDMSQRAVVVAGVLALHRLREIAPEHAADVLAEAKKLAPKRDARSTETA